MSIHGSPPPYSYRPPAPFHVKSSRAEHSTPLAMLAPAKTLPDTIYMSENARHSVQPLPDRLILLSLIHSDKQVYEIEFHISNLRRQQSEMIDENLYINQEGSLSTIMKNQFIPAHISALALIKAILPLQGKNLSQSPDV